LWIVEGILNIQAEQNENNGANNKVPYALPYEVVKMSTDHFGNYIVNIHLKQLQHIWTSKNIKGIKQDY
jgi:frataxin-like iron-binding protein CyaY